MDHFDDALAARVWQRVQASPAGGPDPGALGRLIAGELTDAAVYLNLARRMGGKSAVLQRLAREAQAHASCLQGICVLVSGQRAEVTAAPPASESTAAVLKKCYVNHLGRLREYESCMSYRDFAPAFEKLAAGERAHCATLLELIGKAAP